MAGGGRDAAVAGGHRDVADDLRPYRERLVDALADVEAIDSADPGGVVDRLARFGLGDGLPVVVPEDGLDRGAARWPCGRWTRHQRAATDQLRRADLVGPRRVCGAGGLPVLRSACSTWWPRRSTPPPIRRSTCSACRRRPAQPRPWWSSTDRSSTGSACTRVPARSGPAGALNATIGRAVRLALSDVGLCRPGVGDMATHGHPGKFTWLVAENQHGQPLGAAVGRARDDGGHVGGHGVPRRGQRRGRAPGHRPGRRRRPVRRRARRPGRRPLRRPRPAGVGPISSSDQAGPATPWWRRSPRGAAAGRWWS